MAMTCCSREQQGGDSDSAPPVSDTVPADTAASSAPAVNESVSSEVPPAAKEQEKQEIGNMEIKITSPAFENGKPIPAKFTADGDDVSPILEWSPGPRGTVSYALIMDDPDAPRGTWVHWIAWNITDTRIKEDSRSLTEGRNSWNRVGYGGPAPPSGTHRYFFRIYALDTMLDLPDSTDVNALKKAMRGHVLAQGELMGTYSR